MSTQQQLATSPGYKRLNINLPLSVYSELEELARTSSRNMTDIVRTALGLVKIAVEAEQSGNKLAIVKSDGKLLKEILLVK